MLSKFRDHIKGWIAWVFVILVSVPFALWGIGNYTGFISSNAVAAVNGQEISPQVFQNAYRSAYQQRQEALGDKFDPSPAEEKALKQLVIQQLITSTLLQQQAQDYHMVVTDADVYNQISQMPIFQLNGKFSLPQFRAILTSNNMTPDAFEASVRTSLKSQLLQRGLTGSAFATPQEAATLVSLVKEKRKMAWASLPVTSFKPTQPPSEADIKAYYDQHQADFTTPATVTLNFLQLDPAALKAGIEVKPEDLIGWYHGHLSAYGTPPARKAAQILIKPTDSGTEAWAAAEKRAQELLAKIHQSGDGQKEFAALAKANSDDPISRRNAGSIGYVGRGQMPKPFDTALFGIEKIGAVAGPVRTDTGWVLIQLLDERPGKVKPFADVKEQVKTEYLKSQVRDRYFKLGEQLANLTFENAASLEPAAKALGLKIGTVTGVTLEQGSGIAANEDVRKAAFSHSVLEQHRNSEPVKLGEFNAVVVRVAESHPSALKPLAEVQDKIVVALDRARAAEQAQAAALQALTALRSGQTLAAVAQSAGVAEQGPITFSRAAPPASVPVPLVRAVFATPVPNKNKTAYGITRLADGSPVLFALQQVIIPHDATSNPSELAAYNSQLTRLQVNQEMDAYVAWLRAQAEIKVNPDNMP